MVSPRYTDQSYMTFNSLIFVTFFPIVFLLYWGVGTVKGKGHRLQNWLLLAASYLFYGWWDWRYLGLLAGVTLTTYVTARLTERGHRRLWTGLNVAICVLTLATFKYFNFFSENLQWLFATFGWNVDWFTLEVLLPVGISFYTFQAIGYSVDVYRREITPERRLSQVALFLAYFPQLVAGPIERASQLMPQLKSPRRWSCPMAVDGARQALWGMFKKVVIADTLALYVDSVMAEPTYYLEHSPLTIIAALLLFMVVIYCDFSGYCDIARGVSRCLGIELMQNFRYPLFARNVRERWQRWNVSLMHWFRSYVYFPLGGSRCSRLRASINVVIVFLISGLWHGAAWTFVIWGAYWGVVTAISRFLPKRRLPSVSPCNGIPFTLALTALSYVFFRSQSTAGMWAILPWSLFALMLLAAVGEAMVYLYYSLTPHRRRVVNIVAALCLLAVFVYLFSGFNPDRLSMILRWLTLVWVAVMFAVEWRNRHLTHALERMPRRGAVRLCCYMAIVLLIMISTAENTTFIYYQF